MADIYNVRPVAGQYSISFDRPRELLLRFLVSQEWHSYRLRHCVTLENGELGDGVVMRRRAGGKLVYRRATDDELEDYEWAIAIK